MDRRQKFERRNTDRRTEPKKTSLSKNKLILIGMLLLAFVCIYRSSSSSNSNETVAERNAASKRRYAAKDYESFRKEVQQRDQDLLDKWRTIKEERRYNPNGPDHARQHYEEKLAELEDGLDKHRKSLEHKDSIAWSLKQDIKKLKSDPPPR